MEVVGPDTGGALWVGCVRARFSLLPWRWPALFLDLVIRAFRLLRQPWLGRYSHLFLWHGTTIWEASTIWRRGDIRDYDRRDVIVDAMEVTASPHVGGASRPASTRASRPASTRASRPACARRSGGTGFPACGSRAETARLQPRKAKGERR